MKLPYNIPYHSYRIIFASFNEITLKNSDCDYNFVISCRDKIIIESFNKIKIIFDDKKCPTKSISCKISVTKAMETFESFNWFNIIKKTDDNIALNATISIESYEIDNILNNITLFKNSSSLTIITKSVDCTTNSIQNIKGVDVLKIYFLGTTRGINLVNNIEAENLSIYFPKNIISNNSFQNIRTKRMYMEFNKTNKRFVMPILKEATISTDSLIIKTDVDLNADDIKSLSNLSYKEIKIIKG